MFLTKDQLKQKFELPLPGLNSHLKMAPQHRAEELKNKLELIHNARKSAVMILFFQEDNMLKMIAIRRSVYVGIHSGQIAFPGGRYEEEDGDVRVTALREIEEEIGIPEDKIEIIFERFRQVDNSNTRQYGGTGLGLSISRGLVKLFNGDIWVETEVNKGSTFYFTIPYQPVLKFEKEMKITSNQMYNWENKKILITEDDEFNALYITEILASTKINILIANSGKEALDLFNKNNDIDIVLMDVMLPDINGINLTKELKKIKNNQIIIAQTAFYSCDDKNECINAGCKDFISKPINKTVLLNLLNGHLSN